MKDKIRKILICIALILSTILISTSVLIDNIVYADSETGKYTDVLQDLKRDSNFNAEDYPVNAENYSLQVIQIAENVENKLFVYVYQPCVGNVDLIATCINMSLGKNTNNKLYNLKFINSNDVFVKYRVEDYVISNENARYYDIVSIYRKWYKNYDNGLEKINNNDISEVAFNVSKEFVISVNGDYILTTCYDIETIEIVNKYVGFVRYNDSYWESGMVPFLGRYEPGFDGHFVAFSTNKTIDSLLEADVYYTSQVYSYDKHTMLGASLSENENFSEKEEHTIELTYTSVGGGTGDNFRKYEWPRIQTVADFIKTENREYVYSYGLFNVREQIKLTNEALEDLRGMQWVLRFTESDFVDKTTKGLSLDYYTSKKWTIVGDVTILRLKFETDGVSYNLGCIDNKQSGDGIPDNIHQNTIELAYWFKKILSVVLLILLVVLSAPLLPTIFKIIITILSYILKAILFVLKLPITIVKKIKNKGGGKNASCKNKK